MTLSPVPVGGEELWRTLEGDDLSSCAVHKFSLSGAVHLIAVDNGINSHRKVLPAQPPGVDVMVIDHHRIQEQAKPLTVWSQAFDLEEKLAAAARKLKERV